MKILLVEDDENLVRFLNQTLTDEGFVLESAMDGNKGLEMALSNKYNIILLDIMLPGLNGFEIIREIRENKITTPVIMITAKSEVDDKIHGLNLGADDYLAKPFSYLELVARINALLRRTNFILSTKLTFENLELDLISHIAFLNHKPITLTIKEYEMLELLLRNKEQAVTRDDITKLIWKAEQVADSNIIDVYIKRLRTKLGKRNNGKNFIHSIRGIGYIIGDKPSNDRNS